MTLIWGAALLLAAQNANPSVAADAARSMNFRQNGTEFVVSLPEGMCVPQGIQIDVSNLLAAADEANVTHATMVSCDGQRADIDYAIIKVPRSILLATVDRNTFLDDLQREMNVPDFRSSIADGSINRNIERSYQDLGMTISIQAGVGPLGRDEMCVYMGGIAHFEGQEPSSAYDIAVGSCLTAIEGKPMAVHYYGDETTDQGVAALLGEARALASRIAAR